MKGRPVGPDAVWRVLLYSSRRHRRHRRLLFFFFIYFQPTGAMKGRPVVGACCQWFCGLVVTCSSSLIRLVVGRTRQALASEGSGRARARCYEWAR